MEFLKHWLTGRDNASYSAVKIIALVTAFAMVFNFVKYGSVDFQALGIGVSGVITSLAAKYWVEGK